MAWSMAATRNTRPPSGCGPRAAPSRPPPPRAATRPGPGARHCAGSRGVVPLGRTGRGRHHRGRYDAAGDIGGPAAERGVQRVGVQLAQHPAEGPFAGHQEPAGQRMTTGPQTGKLVLRGPRGPLPDRGHRVTAHHQRGARRQRQDHHQSVPQAPPPTQVRNLRQPRHQHGLRLGRVSRRPQLPLGQTVRHPHALPHWFVMRSGRPRSVSSLSRTLQQKRRRLSMGVEAVGERSSVRIFISYRRTDVPHARGPGVRLAAGALRPGERVHGRRVHRARLRLRRDHR